MDIQLIRHATLLVSISGKILLIDPMLSEKEAMPPIINSPNDRRNPLVGIGIPTQDYLGKADAVLLTHTHRDHFDDAAASLIPKDMPLLCQPEDKEKLQSLGFQKIIPVEEEAAWEGMRFIRTQGRHGTGEIGQMMAPVSGYVIEAQGEPSLYIAGDTIYCSEVEAALHLHSPQITVVNAGGARFNTGDPITMTAEDVVKVLRFAPGTTVIAVHMEAINHCLVTRQELAQYLQEQQLMHRVYIPLDSETIKL